MEFGYRYERTTKRAIVTATNTPNKRRNLTTSWKVAASDKIARQVITIGGLATIAAVLLVVFVLFSNVIPLFKSTTVGQQPKSVKLSSSDQAVPQGIRGNIIHSGVDEFTEIAWFLTSAGDVYAKAVYNDALLVTLPNEQHSQDRTVTSSFRDRSGNSVLLGYSDGSIQSFDVKFVTEFVKPDELDAEVKDAFAKLTLENDLVVHGSSTYRRLRGQLVRKQQLVKVSISGIHQLTKDNSAVLRLSASTPRVLSSFDQSTETIFVGISSTSIASGTLARKASQFSDEITIDWNSSSSPLPSQIDANSVTAVLVHQQGNLATLCQSNGLLSKWQLSSAGPAFVGQYPIRYAREAASKYDLSEVSATNTLLGDNTLLVGGQSGAIVGTFLAPGLLEDQKPDEIYYGAHPFKFTNAPIKLLASSPGSRVFAALDATGQLTLCYAPNDQILTSIATGSQNAKELWINLRQDRVGILNETELKLYDLNVAYRKLPTNHSFNLCGMKVIRNLYQSGKVHLLVSKLNRNLACGR